MFSNWFPSKKGRLSSVGRDRTTRKGGKATAPRRLNVESLEDRTLLSVCPGLPQAAGQTASSFYGSSSYGSLRSPAVAGQYTLLLRQNVQSGNQVVAQLEARDVSGRLVLAYNGTANLTTSDAAAKLPSSVTFHNGVARFQVTFGTTGPQSITATDSTNSAITVTAKTSVVAAATATQYSFALWQNVQVGVATTAQLVALDANNHIVTGYNGTATLTSSDTAATVPASVTFKNGFATFQVTFATPGSQTGTATDSSNALLTGTATTTVATPDVVAQLEVDLGQNVPNGRPVTVRMFALDANDNVVRSYSGTVKLTSTDAAATLPATVTFNNGVATFQVTFATAGSQTLTATDSSDATLTGSVTTIVAAPVVASQYSVRLQQRVRSGVPATVQILALDSSGMIVRSYSGTANVTSSDTAATLPATVTFQNGVATFQVTFATAGSQTVTATDSSASSLTATATTNVVSTTPTPTPTPTPSPGTGVTSTTSGNWSGYAVTAGRGQSTAGSVTAVTGTWTVPAVTGTGTAYSAVWVGIDGANSSTVEQIGTESDIVNGTAQYSVWYEMYPSYSVDITSMTIAPGDTITATVQYLSSGQFQLTITDTTQANDTFTTTQSAPGAQRSSAEWIVEAPSSMTGILPLANFSSVAFSNATATINGTTGSVDNSGWQTTAINIATRGVVQTATSALADAAGVSSFSVAYNSGVTVSPYPGGQGGGRRWRADQTPPQGIGRNAGSQSMWNIPGSLSARDLLFASWNRFNV